MPPITQITDEEAQRPFLPQGDYGSGLNNDADVELARFEYPAQERPCPWDKDGTYAYFGFTVVTPDGNKHYPDAWVQPSSLKKFLLALGVEVSPNPTGPGFTFDDGSVAPRKVTGVRLGKPREYQGEMRTGTVRTVLSS